MMLADAATASLHSLNTPARHRRPPPQAMAAGSETNKQACAKRCPACLSKDCVASFVAERGAGSRDAVADDQRWRREGKHACHCCRSQSCWVCCHAVHYVLEQERYLDTHRGCSDGWELGRGFKRKRSAAASRCDCFETDGTTVSTCRLMAPVSRLAAINPARQQPQQLRHIITVTALHSWLALTCTLSTLLPMRSPRAMVTRDRHSLLPFGNT